MKVKSDEGKRNFQSVSPLLKMFESHKKRRLDPWTGVEIIALHPHLLVAVEPHAHRTAFGTYVKRQESNNRSGLSHAARRAPAAQFPHSSVLFGGATISGGRRRRRVAGCFV